LLAAAPGRRRAFPVYPPTYFQPQLIATSLCNYAMAAGRAYIIILIPRGQKALNEVGVGVGSGLGLGWVWVVGRWGVGVGRWGVGGGRCVGLIAAAFGWWNLPHLASGATSSTSTPYQLSCHTTLPTPNHNCDPPQPNPTTTPQPNPTPQPPNPTAGCPAAHHGALHGPGDGAALPQGQGVGGAGVWQCDVVAGRVGAVSD